MTRDVKGESSTFFNAFVPAFYSLVSFSPKIGTKTC